MHARNRRSIATAIMLAHAFIGAHAAGDIRPSSKMMQFPDVSATDIVFVYANDLWLVPREGGMARPLASPPGREMFPKFSPDGGMIAFVGNYDGNRDIYVIPAVGGPARRVTHHPAPEFVTDWTPDGKIIYYAAGQAGLVRQEQIFIVDPNGGMPERLPVPYGTNGTISPDGQWLAYTPFSRDFRTWKRYRGGWASDVWLFNLKDHTSRRVTDWEGTDTIPMWQPGRGEILYYLSDDGPAHRLNIWSYNTRTGARQQITDFRDYDIKWPSVGPGPGGRGEIVFQNGENIHLLDLATGRTRAVDITVPGDRPHIREQQVDASKFIQQAHISPSGKRIAFEARGDIWSVPAVEGVTRNLTRTSGVAERDPLFSPDGRWIAYLSDETGEYELYLVDADGRTSPRRLTSGGDAYRYTRSWSPDSRRIVFTDKAGRIFLHTLGGEARDGSEEGTTVEIARDLWANQTPHAWSHDSAWLALVLGHENTHNTIWLYELATGALTQVTSEMFNASFPAFDRKGEWLYFTSNRRFSPVYSDIDSTWVYRNSGLIYAVPLRADVKDPLATVSDEEKPAGADDAKKNDKKDEKKGAPHAWAGRWRCDARESAPGAGDALSLVVVFREGEGGAPAGAVEVMGTTYDILAPVFDEQTKTISFRVEADQVYTVSAVIEGESMKGTWTAADGRSGVLEGTREKDAAKDAAPIAIDLDGFERRAIEVPAGRGGFSTLAVSDAGRLLYLHSGDEPGAGADLKIIDFLADTADKRQPKTVVAGVNLFQLSADGKKALVRKGQDYAVVDAAPDQKMDKKAPLSGMTALVSPREEWGQVFHDAWRIFRDFFYEDGLHQVDWNAQREAYARLLADCASRDDVTFVIAEMISELNVGHAYYRPGDLDSGPPAVGVGLLGADYELATQDGITAYRITRILEGGPWDADARGPLSRHGVDAAPGDFILAVNRVPIDVSKDIWAAFVGTAGRPTSVTLGKRPVIDADAREIVLTPLASEADLRLRAWIEDNRRYAEQRSDGRIGYIYVINTGVLGQDDLVRQFYGQRHLQALIIDDRWNGGGQIPTRFIELLNRPRTNYWARRDGKDWSWPHDSHQGPKAMLINGLSASGGDMFPALFRQSGLGSLIGTRTWGGLVGISGNPQLIDGTAPNVPTFGYYERDGTWGIEGHGVDPDIEVIDDPAKMIVPRGAPAGTVMDPQIDAAIALLENEIRTRGYTPAPRPAGPDRRGMGLPDSDK